MAAMGLSLKQKMSSAEEAVAVVRSGDRVFLHGSCATPHVLIEALVARAPELRGVRVTHLHTSGSAPYTAPGMEESFRHEALFVGSNVRDAVNSGRADYIPAFLSEVPTLFQDGHLPIDVAFLNVSPPDAHGYCSLGTSVDCALMAARTARTVVAQINHSMPRTLGDSFIHIDQVDRAVEVDQPPDDIPAVPPSEVELKIGSYVASLIDDGSTLQMGIGSIPNAVLASLTTHRGLGVHSEMFSDGVVDLVEKGVITGECNTLHPGKLLASFVMGSSRLYKFIDDNPQVMMRPVNYVNDTSVIRRNFRMVAINSAIEIDLTGQVSATSIGDRIFSGVGGQVDFMRGASLARDGKPILALPSTAAGGKQSRIVGHLRPGAMLTLIQGNLHYVVTEYGIAELYGKSLRQRAEALIAIAHPDFRDELSEFARGLNRL